MKRTAVSFAELLLASLILGLTLPAILSLLTGQEREVRHSAHQLDVASLVQGRLGELEGRLAARGFPGQVHEETRTFDLQSGDHRITVRERSRTAPVEGLKGLFEIQVVCEWTEPYAGAEARRDHTAFLRVVDPETGSRESIGREP